MIPSRTDTSSLPALPKLNVRQIVAHFAGVVSSELGIAHPQLPGLVSSPAHGVRDCSGELSIFPQGFVAFRRIARLPAFC